MSCEKRLTGNNFVNGSNPEVMQDGRIKVRHAAEISFDEAACLWDERSEKIKNIRHDYQVAILQHGGDAVDKILSSHEDVFTAKYPINSFDRQIFPDAEDRLLAKNEAPKAKHIYIIADPLNKGDNADIQRVAWHYKNILQAEYVTAVFTYLTGTRQDKNIDPQGDYMASPINIAADIESLTRVDSFMGIENHSFATQTAARTVDKPFFPLTPWKYLMDMVLKHDIAIDSEVTKITPENTVLVRPDKGRNIAAKRISEHYGFPTISFDKKRLNAATTMPYLKDPEDRKMVKGKICICYDDELATNGTVNGIADKLEQYGSKALIIVGVHGKFTSNWEKNINHPLIKKIFTTDSRPPIGNIEPYVQSDKIEILPLERLIAEILKADIKGVNFWRDSEYKHLVLQSNGKGEN